MNRRSVAAVLLAMILPMTGGVAQEQNQTGRQGDGSNAFDPFGRLELTLESRQILVPARLVILSNDLNVVLTVDLNRVFPRSDESRLPILGQTLAQRFRGAEQVGEARFRGRDVIVSVAGAADRIGQVFVLNGAVGTRINAGAMGRAASGRVPNFSDLPLLGWVYRDRGTREVSRTELLILTRPAIVRPRDLE